MIRLPTRHNDLVAHDRRRARRPRMMQRRQRNPRATFRNANTRFETLASNVDPAGTQPPITTMSPRYTTAIA